MGLFGDIGKVVGGIVKDFTGGINGDQATFRPESIFTPDQIKQAYANYNANLQQQQQNINQLAGQNAAQKQNDAYGMLLAQAQGTGPNPALAQLQQQTAQNTANQAALMAGARGASNNPALAARMIAQQGSANQQQAAGQAAVLQAQQQQVAQQALGNYANNMVGNYQNALGNYATSANALGGQMLGQQNQANNYAFQQHQAQLQQQNQMAGQLLGAGASFLTGLPVSGLFSGGNSGSASTPSPNSGTGYLGANTTFKYYAGGKVELKEGDHPDNDIVPAMLSPGEVVLPRSVTQHKDAPQKAMEFVKALQARKGI